MWAAETTAAVVASLATRPATAPFESLKIPSMTSAPDLVAASKDLSAGTLECPTAPSLPLAAMRALSSTSAPAPSGARAASAAAAAAAARMSLGSKLLLLPLPLLLNGVFDRGEPRTFFASPAAATAATRACK